MTLEYILYAKRSIIDYPYRVESQSPDETMLLYSIVLTVLLYVTILSFRAGFAIRLAE